MHGNKNRIRSQSGFSLIEVLVVIAIIGIVSAISIPAYFSWRPKHDLNRAVREYHNLLYKAKATAIKDRGSCTVIFTQDAGDNTKATGYKVVCDDRDLTTCEPASCTFVKTIVLKDEYNSKVVMSTNGSSFATVTVDFNSIGESQVGSPIVKFSHPNVAQVYKINALISGVIKLEEE